MALCGSLVPCIFVFVAFLVVKTRFRPKLNRMEKRRENISFGLWMLVAFLKDLISEWFD